MHFAVNDRTEGSVEVELAFSSWAVSADWKEVGRGGGGVRHTAVTMQKLLHTHMPIHTQENLFSNGELPTCQHQL